MKLVQGQTWNLGDQFFRIVSLERLAVEYKAMKNLQNRDGLHQSCTKKEFCRLIKHAILMTPEEVRGLAEIANAAAEPVAPVAVEPVVPPSANTEG